MPVSKLILDHNAVIHPQWPVPKQVKAIITTRAGGVSPPPWSSFNLATHVGGSELNVRQNRQKLQSYWGNDLRAQWLNQTHSTQVVEFSGGNNTELVGDADAIFTRSEKRICAVLTADCLPVLLCDAGATTVAACHAGWRGLGAGILENTLDEFTVPREDILAFLGPAIGPKYFQIGEDVLEYFSQNGQKLDYKKIFSPSLHARGKFFMDIYEAARQILNNQGLKQVYGGDFCTYRESEQFYSYRRDKACGRMASCIWLDRQ